MTLSTRTRSNRPSFCRGDVVHVRSARSRSTGNEMWSDRPAVIVSNNVLNRGGGVVQVVYLTSSRARETMPTHVLLGDVTEQGISSVAVCNQVTNVDASRLGEVLGHVDPSLMREVNDAIAFALRIGGAKADAAVSRWEDLVENSGTDLQQVESDLVHDSLSNQVTALRRALVSVTEERDGLVLALRASRHWENTDLLGDVSRALDNDKSNNKKTRSVNQ